MISAFWTCHLKKRKKGKSLHRLLGEEGNLKEGKTRKQWTDSASLQARKTKLRRCVKFSVGKRWFERGMEIMAFCSRRRATRAELRPKQTDWM